MVSSGAKIDSGGTQNLSAGVRKTIQSIKEIVGNHSDADIYVALKEANMDPNETTQKLLNQDPFHEVKRRRDKKKENEDYNTAPEPGKNFEQVDSEMKLNSYLNRIVRKNGFSRNASTGVSHEFRIVRDNRVNQNNETKLSPSSTLTDEPASSAAVKSSLVGSSTNQKPPVGRQFLQNSNGPSHSQHRQSREVSLVGTSRKDISEEKLASVPRAGTQMLIAKTNNPQSHSTTSSNSSVIGVYSSSSDPVHVPSRDSRPAANVGAIKREVGVVGPRRQASEAAKPSSAQSKSSPNQSQNGTPHSAMPALSVSRPFSSNQYSSRAHQSLGHSKVPQPSKEWKPKTSQKAAVNGAGVIRMPAKSATDNTKNLESEATQLQDKLSQINVSENQNVIIAAHIRVSESDRCQLTFGSLGTEFEIGSSGFQAVGTVEKSSTDPSGSVSVSALELSGGEPAQPSDLSDDGIQNSEVNCPTSAPASEHQLADTKESSSSQNMENYADIGLIQENNLTYSPSEPQHQQVATELPSFPVYDPRTGYDIPYFRPAAEETGQGQGLPSPQEALSSHTANSIPATTIALGQQQQQQVLAQMYPQLHLSHFANMMPYRQIISPVYVPPMAMPGYSSNAGYPHPSNGSNYVLMPGGSTHLTAGNVKYGMQQFKPITAASPTGFGNFTNPTGYGINNPGVVGGGTGLEDASRLKYKDGDLYVPNLQAETSEMWMNPRDIPSMQSASYYNMTGQALPHAAYMPSHTGHASFNAAAAAAQSSHMQFSAMYHTAQPGSIASPHPLGAAMGGNIGVAAAAPGPQVGAYQQPQLGHLNWTGNF